VLLVPFAIYQRYYVTSREAYLTEHGFGLLAAVGRQLDSFVDSVSKTVSTANKASDEKPDPKSVYTKYLEDFLPDLWIASTELVMNKLTETANSFSVEFGSQATGFGRSFKKVPIGGRVHIDNAVRKRIAGIGEDYFADVLIANTSGDVLFQRSLDKKITNLNNLLPASPPATVATPPVAGNTNPAPPRDKPSFTTLSAFSNVVDVHLAGDDYKLFMQPFRLSPTEGDVTDSGDLVICGLWRTDRLHSDSFALPYSAVIWFGLLCAAAGSFAWPFLKISYMGRTERLRRTDGWLLVLSMFLGATSGTLIVLNAAYSSEVSEAIDHDLRELSVAIKANVKSEVSKAYDQLIALDKDPDVERLASGEWAPQPNILSTKSLGYPYFDIAFWTDKDGKQIAKFTVDKKSTPQTPVNDRDFYKDVVASGSSIAPLLADLDGRRYSLHPLVSTTTGLFSTIIAAPYEKRNHSKITLQALVFHPLSLVNPVLPPEFGYAVLAPNGTVLFHDNPLRNLSEDFYQECKDQSAIRSAVFSDSEQFLDIVYSGDDRRALVSKIKYLGPEPLTLVVFHKTEINRTVNLAIILIVSVLMGIYTITILVIAFFDLLWGATYPPNIIWPHRNNSVRYALVFLLNTALIAVFLLSYFRLWELRLLAFTAGILLLAILGTIFLLKKKRLAIANEKWGKRLQPCFKFTYVFAAVSLLVAMTLVPCLGFFKFSHDAASELAAKHGQLTILNELSDRTNRISGYYQMLEAPMNIAQFRKDSKLDRYDDIKLTFLSFNDETFTTPNDSTPESEKHALSMQDWFDEWLTWVTRLFPSNKLGNEMRMLQFDSSNSIHTKWNEFQNKYFRVQIGSEHPVDSTFSEWTGIGVGGWFWLGALWVLVGLWFFQLMKKIFSPDSQNPVPLERVNLQTIDNISGNNLVLSEPHFGNSGRISTVEGIQRIDFRVEMDNQGTKHYHENAIVVLDHFDFGLDNKLHNQSRLRLLERLVYKDRCRVVLISYVDPVYFLSEADPGILSADAQAATESLVRWTKVMSAFRMVTFLDQNEAAFDRELKHKFSNPQEEQVARWIEDECSPMAYLRGIGRELFQKHRGVPLFDGLLLRNELADRTDHYYSLLWSTLTANERLTLYQLAKDGWANSKNDKEIWQLQRKGFIRPLPMFRVMNESFRRFILKAQDQREISEWERQGQQSSWRTLKFSLIAAIIGLAAWLFYAQKDLFQGAIGYVLTLGAAVTAIANVLGTIKGRSANAPKTPDTNP